MRLARFVLATLLLSACKPTDPLGLEFSAQGARATITVRNGTLEPLGYSPVLIAPAISPSKDPSGDLFLVVTDPNGHQVPVCGIVDQHLSGERRSLEPGREVTFTDSTETISAVHCLKDGQPYYLSVEYGKTNKNGSRVRMYSTRGIRFIGVNRLTDPSKVQAK